MKSEIKFRTSQWLVVATLLVPYSTILFGLRPQFLKAQNLQAGVAPVEPATPSNAPYRSDALTLAGAVDFALKQNLDLQIANIETAKRQQDVEIARSALLPTVGFEADESVNRHNLRALLGIEIPIPTVPHNIGPYQAVHVGPTFAVPVFDLTLVRRYQASGHRLLAGGADESTVREETVLLLVSEYMAHLRAIAAITAAESRVELATRLAHQADDLLKDGVASRIDVSRSQVRLREEQQRLIDAQRDADTSLYALRRIMNMPDSEKIAFTDRQDFFRTPSFDVSDPLATALLQRPELKSLNEGIKVAQSDHKAAVAESVPKLTFDGFWDEQGQTFNTSAPGYQYQVTMSVPIFTGGRLSAERRSTQLAEQRAQKQLAQERDVITEQVHDAQIELQAALHQVELGREEVQLAHEEVSLSQGRFQAGVTDNIEVTAAQDSLAHANDAEIGALFRYNIARAELARATGAAGQTYAHP
ncbi:Outer membrane protein TolC [Bryocella elongata]|uniref:Outer membrane protein TolC n=1 Tax=Bryocella elongata TaxID=863522 RepID=A0A1H5UVK7_9BACT|nr:TolC family protein [Bryocella elongata]SEF79192.1 Outer membrane protein TolC [Bryocella elongata]